MKELVDKVMQIQSSREMVIPIRNFKIYNSPETCYTEEEQGISVGRVERIESKI